MRSWARRAPALLAVLVVGAIATACSDDPNDAAPPTTLAPATTTTTTAPATTPAPSAVEVAPGFVIGFLAPGAGLLGDLATAQSTALTLALDDINAAGGVLGQPVGSVTVPEPPGGTAVEGIDGLVAAGADVVLGPVSSDSAAVAIPAVADRGLVACSASATAPELTANATGVPSFFRMALTDDLLVAHTADELAAYRDGLDPPPAAPLRVTVLAREDDYGTAVGNGLSSELGARGFDTTVIHYHPRTVIFTDTAAEVSASTPDLVVVAAYDEAPLLLNALLQAGVAARQIVGLDGLLVPRLAEQTTPSEPARLDGITIIGTTGDRAFVQRLAAQPGLQQIVYGAQAYDCAVTLALAATAAGTTDPIALRAQVRAVTEGGRTCSSYGDCVRLLGAGEDIDYDGPTGRIALDERGDVTAVRFTVASFEGGQLVERRSTDVDFSELRRQEAFVAAMVTTRIQQALRALGYYDGEITGTMDEATREAIRALQRDLGVPETGEYDEATDAALRARLGTAATSLDAAVRELQQLLTDLGYYTGPIDGRFSTATADAVRALQRDLGVPETGLIDVATLQAIYARGGARATPPTSEVPTTPAATVPPATAPPTTVAPTTPPPTPGLPAVTEVPAPPAPTTAAPATEAPTTTAPVEKAPPDLFDVLAADPRFSTFTSLLLAAGYDEDLAELGPLTVFAPVNGAFDAVPADTRAQLQADPSALAYHVVPELVRSADLQPGASLQTAYGADLAVGPGPTVGGANVVIPDVVAANGIVHGIDAVLVPPPPDDEGG